VPGVRRIATLADSNVTAVAKLNEMQEAARRRNIELSIHRVASGEEIAVAIDAGSRPLLMSTTRRRKLDALQDAARAHNVELSIYRVTRGEEIEAAIDRAQASGATALNIFAGPFLWGNRQLIMDRAVVLHLPTMQRISRNGGGRRLCRLRTVP